MNISRILYIFVLYWYSFFQLTLYVVILTLSHGGVETYASLVYTGDLKGEYNYFNCWGPILSFQVVWDHIDTVCHALLRNKMNYKFVNTYFTTNDGKHFRHCHANYEPNFRPTNTLCFGIEYPEYMWKELTIKEIDDAENLIKIKDESLESYVCFQKKGSKNNQVKKAKKLYFFNVDKTFVSYSWTKQSLCKVKDKGFHDTPPKVLRDTMGMGIQVNEALPWDFCQTYNRNSRVDWGNIRIVCFHYKKYLGYNVFNSYFGGQGNEGSFRHCYGGEGILQDGTVGCFPGKFDTNKWKRYMFSNGKIYGENTFLDEHNVTCYSRKVGGQTMDIQQDVMAWYASQPGCKYYDPAGFYKSEL